MNNKRLTLIYMLSFSILTAPVWADEPHVAPPNNKHVILFIWDGLRPDSVSEKNTPNLYKFMKDGVQSLRAMEGRRPRRVVRDSPRFF